VIIVAATACAVILSRATLPLIQSLVAASIPRSDEAIIDRRVIAFSVALAAVTCVSCWLIPALNLRRLGPGASLRGVGAGIPSHALRRGSRRVLVSTEIAIAVMILAGAALLYRSVDRLHHLDLGFNPQRLLAVGVELPPSIAASDSRTDAYQFYMRAIDVVRTLPFVESVGGVGQRPLKGPIGLDAAVEIEGREPGATDAFPWVNLEPITPEYFLTLGSHARAGRVFNEGDRVTTQPVVIVNEKLAHAAWPGQSAIGKRIRGGALNLGHAAGTWWTVVGVVPDIRYREIGATPLDVYVPFAQSWFAVGDLMVRTTALPATVASAIRARLRQIDPDGLIDIASMERVVEAHEAPWRTNLLLFAAFAVLTVLVASVGLYAMLAATVEEQSRDIGVRTALGATATHIVGGVVGDGMRTVLPGIVAGLAIVAAVGRFMRSLLFEVSPIDQPSLFGAAILLVIVAIVACALPAVRAARIDPATCLRSE